MKKRNWLMTIAFAVLSLTIISTCVIGSTYAKFVSKVTGSGSAQAAGFLLTVGETTEISQDLLIAPTVEAETTMTVNYFSQVATKITDNGATSQLTGAGVFDSTTWASLVSYYNTHYNDIVVALGLGTVNEDTVTLNEGVTGGKVKDGLTVAELITVTFGDSGTSVLDAFKTGLTSLNPVDAGSNAITVDAMAKGEKKAIQVNISMKAVWTTLADGQGGDVFDTFIGNCIGAKHLGQALSYGENQVFAAATAVESTIALSLGVTAEQVIA